MFHLIVNLPAGRAVRVGAGGSEERLRVNEEGAVTFQTSAGPARRVTVQIEGT
jgi:hypothetical protein